MTPWRSTHWGWGAVALVLSLSPGMARAGSTVFRQHNLVSDGFVPADHTDPNLINPWGMAFDPAGGPFWVANQVSGTSTVYNGDGVPFPQGSPLVVRVPSGSGEEVGPTGAAFNVTNGFNLSTGGKTGKGLFFFANLDGSISGWNPSGDATQAVRVVTPSGPAAYTGLAIATSSSGDRMYAANNAAGKIDVFDTNFQAASLSGSFADPMVPAGLVPFNVKRVGNRLAVTYAVPGEEADEVPQGSGAVALFDFDGNLVRHVASGGALASPWGVTMAPAGFGDLGGALLVGNFHDDLGTINAFDSETGAFLGTITGPDGRPITNADLWAITFGNGGDGGRADTLYLVAGIGGEQHGVFASISPAGATVVPLPPALLGGPLGLFLASGAVWRLRRKL